MLDPSCIWIRCTRVSSWYSNGPFNSDLVETLKTNAFNASFNAFVLDRVIGPFGTCNGSLLVFLGWSTSERQPTRPILHPFSSDSLLSIFQIIHGTSDSFATYETIIAVFFCLFSGFYCFLSHIYIWIALLSLFYLVLVSIPQAPQEGETRGVSMWQYSECLRKTRAMWGFCFTTNQFLQVLSCQIKTIHDPLRCRT